MNFIGNLKDELYIALTEKGDKAYTTSGSYCLDFFSLAGGLRHKYANLFNLFLKGFYEDKILSIKLLFYLRDISGGLGERNSFRALLNYLTNLHPEIVKQVIEYVPKYGRFDDLFALFNTSLEEDVLKLIKTQLDEDLINYEKGEGISLLSKWLPSINTSSKTSRILAKKISEYLGYRPAEYRKTLAKLRKSKVLEVYLSSKDYSFDYTKQPSQALFRYQKAFVRNDSERYLEFINRSIEENNLNTSTLFPYQIISKITHREYLDEDLSETEKSILDATWKNIDKKEIDSSTIVVLDGSGSMYYGTNLNPIDVATSLAILFSEQLSGPYKDTFITFSDNPQLVELTSKTIFDKVNEALTYNEVSNTNISKVYDLIFNTAINHNLKDDDLPKRIVIISDMEFDYCTKGLSSFEVIKNKFKNSSYTLPEIIFWNVEARGIHLPITMNEQNIKLISGASKNIIEMITKNDSINPYDFMISVLSKYKEFDKIVI